MEVPVEGEFDFEMNFYAWNDHDKYELIGAIVSGSRTNLTGHLSTTVEVLPPSVMTDVL